MATRERILKVRIIVEESDLLQQDGTPETGWAQIEDDIKEGREPWFDQEFVAWERGETRWTVGGL